MLIHYCETNVLIVYQKKGGFTMIVFSFINLKGGVGKTTVSTNVAIELMQRGLRVLFIDNDEQSNSSFFFNVDKKEKTLATLYKNPQIDIRDVIYSTTYDNIDCIPAGYDLDIILTLYFDRENFKGMDRTSVLKNKLQTVSNDYDVCIIDNHPGINVATYNGLMATNSVIIVTTTDYYAEQGLKAMIKELENVKKDRMNYDKDYDEGIRTKSIRLEGCLINKYINNPDFHKKKQYNYFDTNIRMVVKNKLYLFDSAVKQHKSLIEIAPYINFSKDIRKFTSELLDKILKE